MNFFFGQNSKTSDLSINMWNTWNFLQWTPLPDMRISVNPTVAFCQAESFLLLENLQSVNSKRSPAYIFSLIFDNIYTFSQWALSPKWGPSVRSTTKNLSRWFQILSLLTHTKFEKIKFSLSVWQRNMKIMA